MIKWLSHTTKQTMTIYEWIFTIICNNMLQRCYKLCSTMKFLFLNLCDCFVLYQIESNTPSKHYLIAFLSFRNHSGESNWVWIPWNGRIKDSMRRNYRFNRIYPEINDPQQNSHDIGWTNFRISSNKGSFRFGERLYFDFYFILFPLNARPNVHIIAVCIADMKFDINFVMVWKSDD